MIIALMLSFLMVALSTAQFSVLQKNSQQGQFYIAMEELQSYADSGIRMALHDLSYSVSGNDGKMGTLLWTPANDIGRDGIAATFDIGEGDGIPTPGEPNIVPVSIGTAGEGVNMIVYTEDTAWSEVKRIVATTFTAEAATTLELYAKKEITKLPQLPAIYIDPDVVLDLKGKSFKIEGKDTDPDGTPGTGDPTYGIATEEAPNPGDNLAAIMDQIDSSWINQVTGYGADPSVGEMAERIDIDKLFKSLEARKTNEVSPSTHTGVSWGSMDNMEVTYSKGDLHLTGKGTGSGVLLVDGNLTMSGQFKFDGLVIVRGDVRQTGGGSGTHVYGSLLVKEVFSVIDETELTVTGNADIYFSNKTLAGVDKLLSGSSPYSILFWDQLPEATYSKSNTTLPVDPDKSASITDPNPDITQSMLTTR